MELIPGGADIEVNAQNVHDYVRKYAEFRMVKVAEKALKVIIKRYFNDALKSSVKLLELF